MDYRRFLAKDDLLVLPYLGGPTVDAADRRLKVTPFEPPGWYRFKVRGRDAEKVEPADPPELGHLPAVHGFFFDGRLVSGGARAELLFLIPGDEPARFAPITARRWPSGELLFDTSDFESEVESQVREALATDLSLRAAKGVPAPLRAAYGYALFAQVAARVALPFSPAEVRPHLAAVADEGPARAEAVLRALEAERVVARREMAEMERRRAERLAAAEVAAEREARQQRFAQHARDAEDRAARALDAAGARLEVSRRLGPLQLEVIFRFMDQRFICLVDAATLQVIDSGICLGHPPRDAWVTLESLPSVIKEAIDDGALVILRYP